MAQKRVEPVGGDSLEAGREHPAHEEIIVRVDRQLVLVGPKMLDGVWCSRVEVKARQYKLLRETVGHDLFQKWGAEDLQVVRIHLMTRVLV